MTIPHHDTLAAQLRAWASGDHRIEAAVDLLIAHQSWLRRGDFLAACVHATDPDLVTIGLPARWLNFDEAAHIAQGGPASLPASDSELQVLGIAASLADAHHDRSLHDLLTGLDDRNIALVLDAIAHAAGWHQTDNAYTVTGHVWEVAT